MAGTKEILKRGRLRVQPYTHHNVGSSTHSHERPNRSSCEPAAVLLSCPLEGQKTISRLVNGGENKDIRIHLIRDLLEPSSAVLTDDQELIDIKQIDQGRRRRKRRSEHEDVVRRRDELPRTRLSRAPDFANDAHEIKIRKNQKSSREEPETPEGEGEVDSDATTEIPRSFPPPNGLRIPMPDNTTSVYNLDGHGSSNQREFREYRARKYGDRRSAPYQDEYSTTMRYLYKHYCARCGRSRSRFYHREHPIEPGIIPVPGICRRCWPPPNCEGLTNDIIDDKRGSKVTGEKQIEEVLVRKGRRERSERATVETNDDLRRPFRVVKRYIIRKRKSSSSSSSSPSLPSSSSSSSSSSSTSSQHRHLSRKKREEAKKSKMIYLNRGDEILSKDDSSSSSSSLNGDDDNDDDDDEDNDDVEDGRASSRRDRSPLEVQVRVRSCSARRDRNVQLPDTKVVVKDCRAEENKDRTSSLRASSTEKSKTKFKSKALASHKSRKPPIIYIVKDERRAFRTSTKKDEDNDNNSSTSTSSSSSSSSSNNHDNDEIQIDEVPVVTRRSIRRKIQKAPMKEPKELSPPEWYFKRVRRSREPQNSLPDERVSDGERKEYTSSRIYNTRPRFETSASFQNRPAEYKEQYVMKGQNSPHLGRSGRSRSRGGRVDIEEVQEIRKTTDEGRNRDRKPTNYRTSSRRKRYADVRDTEDDEFDKGHDEICDDDRREGRVTRRREVIREEKHGVPRRHITGFRELQNSEQAERCRFDDQIDARGYAYGHGTVRETNFEEEPSRARNVTFATPCSSTAAGVRNGRKAINRDREAILDHREEERDQGLFERAKEKVRKRVSKAAGAYELDGHFSEDRVSYMPQDRKVHETFVEEISHAIIPTKKECIMDSAISLPATENRIASGKNKNKEMKKHKYLETGRIRDSDALSGSKAVNVMCYQHGCNEDRYLDESPEEYEQGYRGKSGETIITRGLAVHHHVARLTISTATAAASPSVSSDSVFSPAYDELEVSDTGRPFRSQSELSSRYEHEVKHEEQANHALNDRVSKPHPSYLTPSSANVRDSDYFNRAVEGAYSNNDYNEQAIFRSSEDTAAQRQKQRLHELEREGLRLKQHVQSANSERSLMSSYRRPDDLMEPNEDESLIVHHHKHRGGRQRYLT